MGGWAGWRATRRVREKFVLNSPRLNTSAEAKPRLSCVNRKRLKSSLRQSEEPVMQKRPLNESNYANHRLSQVFVGCFGPLRLNRLRECGYSPSRLHGLIQRQGSDRVARRRHIRSPQISGNVAPGTGGPGCQVDCRHEITLAG